MAGEIFDLGSILKRQKPYRVLLSKNQTNTIFHQPPEDYNF
jgi:hypothetical protein